MRVHTKSKIKKMYHLLERRYGDLGWWPADSAFEVMVGAILTQNTAWTNVEKAILALKKAKLMAPNKLISVPLGRLASVIRPAGYHNQKAIRLKNISRFVLDECGGIIAKLKKRDTAALRERLLEINGVGPETADSMLLYAVGKPVFVVDAYTKRIFSRHGVLPENAAYDTVRFNVEEALSGSVEKYNKFHSFLVETGKRFCKKKKPLCGECPIGGKNGRLV